MSQNLPVGVFKYVENTHQFYKDFIKNCNEYSDGGYFLEVDVQYLVPNLYDGNECVYIQNVK